MNKLRILLLGAAAAASPLALGAACSSSSSPPPGAPDGGADTGQPDRTVPDATDARPDTTEAAVDTSVTDGVPPTGDGPLGGLQIVDDPDIACVPAGGTTVTLYFAAGSPPDAGSSDAGSSDAGSSDAGLPDASLPDAGSPEAGSPDGGGFSPAISELQSVGTRRVGGGPDVGGFVTFDVSGANPSPRAISVGSLETDVASEGSTIGAGGIDGTKVVYQQFDPMGTALGPAVTLAGNLTAAPQGLAIGASSGSSLVVWGAGGSLHGAGLTGGVPAGSTFDFGLGTYTSILRASIAINGMTYAIAWTGDPVPGETASSVALATPAGLTSLPVPFTVSSVPFKVRQLVAVPSGYMLLVDGVTTTPNDVYVIPLDVSGNASGAAHRLLGSDTGWGLALQGSTLGVVATKTVNPGDGAAPVQRKLFRPLDLTGAAMGPWVCVGADESAGQRADMAIDADGTGFAVTSRTPSDDEVLTRFNAMGR